MLARVSTTLLFTAVQLFDDGLAAGVFKFVPPQTGQSEESLLALAEGDFRTVSSETGEAQLLEDFAEDASEEAAGPAAEEAMAAVSTSFLEQPSSMAEDDDSRSWTGDEEAISEDAGEEAVQALEDADGSGSASFQPFDLDGFAEDAAEETAGPAAEEALQEVIGPHAADETPGGRMLEVLAEDAEVAEDADGSGVYGSDIMGTEAHP